MEYDFLLRNDFEGFANCLLKDNYCAEYLCIRLCEKGKYGQRAREFLKSDSFAPKVAKKVIKTLTKLYFSCWDRLDSDPLARLESNRLIFGLGFIEINCWGKLK